MSHVEVSVSTAGPTGQPGHSPNPGGWPANRGVVEIGQDEDWFRIVASEDTDYFTLSLIGEPTVLVDYELVDSQEEPIEFDVGGTPLRQVITATAPAATYYLHVYEPPRSVVFVWDNSCSVSPYRPAIYQSLQPLDSETLGAVIAAIVARNLARTPIADSLLLVAQDMVGTTGQKVVILVTDGEETCDGDPRAAIQTLQEQGINVRVNIVGFAIADEALKAEFEVWATLGGGLYFYATDAAGLNAAILRAVQTPFRVLDAAGTEVERGLVNDGGVDVPPGTYAVEVLSVPMQRFEAVEVPAGQTVLLKVATGGSVP